MSKMINKIEVQLFGVVNSHLHKFNVKYVEENIKILIFPMSLIICFFNFLFLSQNFSSFEK
jgi:hypothetical protein